MRRAPYGALGAVAVFAVTVALAADPGPPLLDFPERVFDAGKVERGVTVRHTFLVKNPGTVESSIDAKPG